MALPSDHVLPRLFTSASSLAFASASACGSQLEWQCTSWLRAVRSVIASRAVQSKAAPEPSSTEAGLGLGSSAMPGGVDYARFDRLVAEDEREDRALEAQRRAEEEERARRDADAQRQRELRALDRAEEAWQGGSQVAAGTAGEAAAEPGPHEDRVGAAAQAAVGLSAEADPDPEEALAEVDVDDFFRLLTAEEREERQRLKRERQERRLQREEAAGVRPLRDAGLTPEERLSRIEKLDGDRREMSLLLERSDRPAVRARLGEFLLEMDNELARLRSDPLELDDEDRQALRAFHLRKMQLPGTARARSELLIDEAAYAPQALAPGAAPALRLAYEEPWREVTTFALDLGDERTPSVTLDVRLEAVERLPTGSVRCDFGRDSFDLQVEHGLEGRRYRLRRTCLLRDIDPSASSFCVRRNHVVVSLAKAADVEPALGAGGGFTTDYRLLQLLLRKQWQKHISHRKIASLGADIQMTSMAGGAGEGAAHPSPAGRFAPWADLCAQDRHSRNPPFGPAGVDCDPRRSARQRRDHTTLSISVVGTS